MTTAASEQSQPGSDDPYVLTQEGVKEPPKGWLQSIRYLGPGLMLSASIVGSGELIATTTLGAKAGFAILWMVIVSTLVKVAVQIELARWAVSTGGTAITGYNKVPPRIGGRIGWITPLWAILALSKVLQLGGIIGGVALAFSVLVPIGGGPTDRVSTTVWALILIVFTIAILYSNRYGLLERGAGLLVGVFTLFTVLVAVGLPFTPFAYSAGDLASGLKFEIPAGAVGAAIAMFGITGVGADEITFYPYWCLEKGYARWAGPPDGSDAWVRRANGWVKVMYKDALLSWIVYTFSTLGFFVMGAAVLHSQNLVPGEDEMITTLSRMYTDALGPGASVVFLIGAIAVLGSTLWAAVPSWARMYTEFLSTFGVLDWKDPRARLKWVRIFTVALPIVWGAAFLFVQQPVLMVQIGGAATGIFLMAVVVAVWYLRKTEVDERLYGGWVYYAALIVSSIAIGLLGIYTILSTFGVLPGS